MGIRTQPRGGPAACPVVRPYEPAKLERAALRWFRRYLEEDNGGSLLNAQVALAALAELRAGQPEQAEALLMGLARRL